MSNPCYGFVAWSVDVARPTIICQHCKREFVIMRVERWIDEEDEPRTTVYPYQTDNVFCPDCGQKVGDE